MPHLLEVEGLTTVFDSDYGRTVSVDHVNFHVDKGEVVCIVGESGCGKSVTSLSIMGLLGRGGTVTEGSVVFYIISPWIFYIYFVMILSIIIYIFFHCINFIF